MNKNSFTEKLFFPEPIFDLNQISTSAFLYFQRNLAMTLHPTVSLYTTGCDPYKFMELLDASNYDFKTQFKETFNIVNGSTKFIHETLKLIKPIHANGFMKTIWLVYPRNDGALIRSEEIISKSGLSKQELLKMIDPVLASHELISHVLFEKFLEIYDDKIDKDYSNRKDKTFDEIVIKNIDYQDLLSYCDSLFKNNDIEDLLLKSYFFRFQSFEHFPDILLTNEKLIPFLEKINVHKLPSELSHYDNLDIVSWEIFRQLTGRYLEEKSHVEQINKILDLLTNSNEEIEILKNKCLKLAEEFKGGNDLKSLKGNIAQHIKVNTEKEIKELLKLDRDIVENVIDSIFSDEKTWIALGTFIFSVLTGGTLLTAGSALAAFSNIAAKSYKEVAELEKNISKSDYALIYRIKK